MPERQHSGLGRLHHRPIADSERSAAIGLLAHGMRNNPLHSAVFGPDPNAVQQNLERMFARLITVTGRQLVGAFSDDRLVGVLASAAPGSCRLGPFQKVRAGIGLFPSGPNTLARVLRWQHVWQARDPDRPHEHFGPFAVDPAWQGLGVGRYLLGVHTSAADRHGWLSYLETDKSVNVGLYERFGYAIVAQTTVFRVRNWFMQRQPG